MHKLFCWSAHEVLCSTSTALFSILQVQLVQLRRPSFSEKSRAILEPSIDSVSLKFLAEIGFTKSYLDKGRGFRRSAKAPIEHAPHNSLSTWGDSYTKMPFIFSLDSESYWSIHDATFG